MIGQTLLFGLFFGLCSYYQPISCTRVLTTLLDTTFEAGEKISIKWWYEIDINSEMLKLKCGKKNESVSQLNDDFSDIIVLAEMSAPESSTGSPSFKLASPMPVSYSGRVKIQDKTRTGMTITINPLQDSDSGRYFCILQLYDNKISETTVIRSFLRKVTSSPASAAQSNSSSNTSTILIIIFIVLIAVTIVIIIGVFIYKRKTNKQSKNHITQPTKSKPDEAEKLKKSISIVKQPENEAKYAKVQIVATPEDALMGKKIVYIDEDEEYNGFV